MFNTSQDILNLVLAFCTLWVTVFFCWLLYHVVGILRAVEGFMENMQKKVDRIDDAIRGVKDRLEHSIAHLGTIGDAAKHIMKYFAEQKKHTKKDDSED
jgi:uncharacterized membrane protein